MLTTLLRSSCQPIDSNNKIDEQSSAGYMAIRLSSLAKGLKFSSMSLRRDLIRAGLLTVITTPRAGGKIVLVEGATV